MMHGQKNIKETLDRTLWGTRCERIYGQTTDLCLIVTKSKHVARANLTIYQ